MSGFISWVIVIGVVAGFVYLYNTPQAKANRAANAAHEAAMQAQIVCPHCQVRGLVTRSLVTRKQGVSGGKATGAIVTGGASLFVTGLSRKQQMSRMTCGNCGQGWDVA